MSEAVVPYIVFSTAEVSHQNLKEALHQVNELARNFRTQAYLSESVSKQWAEQGDQRRADRSLARAEAFKSAEHLVEETMLGAMELFELYELAIAVTAPPKPNSGGD